MDLFNRKRVAKLEEKLRDSELQNSIYSTKVAELRAALEEASELEETIPEDCVKGPWCKACEFVKTIQYSEPCSPYALEVTNGVYVCGKGASCRNFVQKNV
jgi:hypothetical protein